MSRGERGGESARRTRVVHPQRLVVALNIVIVVAMASFTLAYLSDMHLEHEKARTDMFISNVETMKQAAQTYIASEQGYVNNWARFITDHDMTEDEALDYIRSVNTQPDRWAHIVDMETMDARSTAQINGSDEVDFYKQFLDKREMSDVSPADKTFMESINLIYDGNETVLGRYRPSRSSLSVIAVGTRVTLSDDTGRRDYLLLRLMPVEEMRKMWAFPTEFITAEIGIIDRAGSYVLPSASMRSESFLDFIRAYNFPDDYHQVDSVQGTLLNTDSGTLYFRDSAGEECCWYYSSFGDNSQLDILGYVKARELVSNDETWRMVVSLVCGGLLLLMIIDGIALLAVNRRLKDAAASARQANAAKTKFLSSMSHDIRTPMNAVLGMTAIAKENINDPERVSDCLDKITASGNHLLTLINDILDISQVESGKVSLNPAPFSVRGLIGDIEEMLRAQIGSKRIAFSQTWGALPHDTLVGDKLRIAQVLINLLTNAAKYTPEGGNVSLEVREEPVGGADNSDADLGCTRLVFVVEDNGMGMAEEFQKVMYDSFSRATTSQLNTVQGTGLGLAIVKRLVDLMGGTIECSSALQRGTRFTIALELPWAQEAHAIETSSRQEPDSVVGMHVLIAEDNDLNWEVVSELLASHGAICERAKNGSECLEKLAAGDASAYDAVLMDIQMPVMNGIEATRAIRCSEDPRVRDIPVVAMTADAFAQDVQTCLDAGMDAHIAKPIDIQAALQCLARLRNKPGRQSKGGQDL